MSKTRPRVRLRQAVLVAEDLEPTASALRRTLGLGEPFHDPGVGEFGLSNAVFAIGDCFLEVIAPTQSGTAAERYLERHGGRGAPKIGTFPASRQETGGILGAWIVSCSS